MMPSDLCNAPWKPGWARPYPSTCARGARSVRPSDSHQFVQTLRAVRCPTKYKRKARISQSEIPIFSHRDCMVVCGYIFPLDHKDIVCERASDKQPWNLIRECPRRKVQNK